MVTRRISDRAGRSSVKSIAVRDADVGSDETKYIFSLPEASAPEKEVFSCDKFSQKFDEFSVDFNKIVYPDFEFGHHDFIKKVAEEARMDETHI